MTVQGGSVVDEAAARREVWGLVGWLRRVVGGSGCRVCRVYWLGRRTVALRLPGRRLVVVHFYTRRWKLTPSRVAAVVEAAEGLREALGGDLKRRVIIVVWGAGAVTSGARRLARALGATVAASAAQARAALKSMVAAAEFVGTRMWGWLLRLGEELGTVVALAAVRLGLPASMPIPSGPPPGRTLELEPLPVPP